MPGAVLMTTQEVLEGAVAEFTEEALAELEALIKDVVAEEMDCLDWDNETPTNLDRSKVTLTVLAGFGLDGGEVSFSSTSAALVKVYGFAYSSRMDNRRERLLNIARRVKELLKTDGRVEAEFFAQTKDDWVAV